MKIGINVDPVLPSSCHYYRGIGVYTAALIKGLQEIDSENEYILFYTSKKGEPAGLRENNNFKFRRRPILNSFFLNNLINYGLKDIDILHYPSAEGPSRGKIIIATVHDLIPLKYPTRFIANSRYRLWNQTRYGLIRRATKVIADSEHTKKDLIEYLHIKPDKIRVIYLGVDNIFCCQRDIPKKYILTAGAGWNKNTKAVVMAYHKLKLDLPLMINAIPDKELMAQLQEYHLEGKVFFSGYLSRQEQVALYNGAIVFVFPSIEEGFGLPLLEAMACGLPVIASRTASSPEVVGTAGILVDPYNISEITVALDELVQDSALRRTLSQRSIERAGLFSWTKTAKKTLEVYRASY